MFEAGIELKRKYGEEAVCDFSLGNPDLTPPASIIEGLRNLADEVNKPAGLGYMPNAGYDDVRQALAEHLSAEQATPIGKEPVTDRRCGRRSQCLLQGCPYSRCSASTVL